jgi:hypothetical protein
MRRYLVIAGVIGLWQAAALNGQAEPSVTPDPLLGRLVGQWTMTGTVRERPATYRLDVTWVLQQRFIELHMQDVKHMPPLYEARVFIGADTLLSHYIAHWLDNFGAAYSVPPATGTARGDTLTLDFPYPVGAFHDTFVYDRATDTWRTDLLTRTTLHAF